MPQLMPLLWIMYVFYFFILVFMMKVIYSVFIFKKLDILNSGLKFNKNTWFW